MRVDIPVGLQLLSEPVSYAAVEEDGTSGLVIEVFDDRLTLSRPRDSTGLCFGVLDVGDVPCRLLTRPQDSAGLRLSVSCVDNTWSVY